MRTSGFFVIRWIESNCVHTNGEWIGKHFRLLPWQKRFILRLFTQDEDGERQYRWSLLGVPKKNGKTELAAALALYFLIGDGEPSPFVVCAAASEDQADLVFGAAKTMCELSSTLAPITERWDKEITVPSIPGAKLRRVAAAAGTNDGLNISALVCDELHEWVGRKGEQVWNILTNAFGARRQPMVLQITTAGYDKETVCGRQYDKGRAIERGEIQDERFLFEWWEAEAGANHREPATWAACNPSYGVLVHEDFFADQLTKKTEAVYRRYFQNEWTQTEEIWVPHGVWERCQSSLELDPSLPLRVGIDIGLKHDSAAVACAQLVEGRLVCRTRVWSNPYPREHSQHHQWRLNIAEVENYLAALYERFKVPATEIDGKVIPGPEFSYDPHFFERSAQILEGNGLAMVEYPQSDARMIPASQNLYELIVTGRLAHDGDATLRAHIHNVVADEKPRGWRMSKPRGTRKHIDAAIALGIAALRALQPAPEMRRPARVVGF
jgi:phage terminase large subunit-like protein